MKRIDFPVKPHLLKFLVFHMKLERVPGGAPAQFKDHKLAAVGRFDWALSQLLRKPAKSARHEASIETCTARLGLDLSTYRHAYYDLLQGKLEPYVVFQFNELVDEVFKEELYWWVREHRTRRSTIKDAIRSFMVFFDIHEEEVAYETLRKNVQRNAGLPTRKKKKAQKAPKTENFPLNLSQKNGGLSQKMSSLSQKTGVLSQKDIYAVVREALRELPLPIFESELYHARP